MSRDKYLGLKRLLAILASVGLWGVSMYFSYKGFEFESTSILWFGQVLAVVVTVVELVFNTKIKDLNMTLLAAGIVCYLYGIYTNITGFYILQHGELVGFFTGTNWLIPSFAGLISEILPEALFAWGWGAGQDGDAVGNIVEVFSNNQSSSNDGGRPERGYDPRDYGNSRSTPQYGNPASASPRNATNSFMESLERRNGQLGYPSKKERKS